MKRFFVFLGVVFMTIGSAVSAQEVDSIAPLQKSSWGDAKTSEMSDYIPDVALSMRGGYNQDFAEKAGRFCGDGIYLDINGKITPSLTYSINQTIASRYIDDVSGFNGTNWLTLNYEVGNFGFTAGKDGLLVGSFEYDGADIDSYYEMNSMFYNMLDCWQWGLSAAYYPADNHEIRVQAANSPLSYGEPNLFAYAAAWRGYWDCYESYWTANMWQYGPGEYVKSLNLGNRFYFGGFTLDLEYMTRAHAVKGLFSNDFTTMLVPAYEWEWGRAFGKLCYEHVGEELPYELAYQAGNYLAYGAGLEIFPLKEDKSVRVHAIWASDSLGANLINIGLTWTIDFTGAAKKLFARSYKQQ